MSQEINHGALSAKARYAFRHVIETAVFTQAPPSSFSQDLMDCLQDQSLPGHVKLNLFSEWESRKALAGSSVRPEYKQIEEMLKKGASEYMSALA